MESKRKQLRGSMTLFVALTMMLVASLIFTLLESARVCGLRAYTRMTADLATECLFSEYCDWVFQNYDVFLLDASFGGELISPTDMDGELMKYSTYTLDPADHTWFGGGVNFYRMQTKEACVTDYLLATDGDGAAFYRMVCAQNKYVLSIERARELMDSLSSEEETVSETPDMESIMDSAQADVEDIRAENRADEDGVPDKGYARDVENPIDTVKALGKKDALNLVVPKGKAISAKKIDTSDLLEKRTKNVGTMAQVYEEDPLDFAWFQLYMDAHFGCYGAPHADDISHALDYELEYIVGGKTSDRANLKVVVAELLAVREAANFLYLETDSVKREAALALATAILAPTGVGEAAAVVLQQGILAAWAFAESVLDVRALLDGKKIAWVKTEETWTCSVENIASALSGSLESKACEDGTDYHGYLSKLIWFKSSKTAAMRTMQLIESNYRLTDGHALFRMDNCVVAAETAFTYEAKQLFLSFVTVLGGSKEYGAFHGSGAYQY